ncbi:MAG: LysR family transcriptional regulator [Pseudomonadota bacterium]
MLDELRQIAIFAKTVDHGSFRAAAKALRLSPSVVSHHVGQLERRLGTALLYRSTRKLSLTPDGERLLTAAHTMIEAAEAGLHAIGDQSPAPSGKLRITAPAVFAQSDLIVQFGEFAVAYSKVQLSVDFSDTRRDLIADGYDVAIRAGELEDSAFKARKLIDMRRGVVASPAYLNVRPKPETPRDLSDWDWLELAPVWDKKTEFRNGRRRESVATKNPRVSVNNAHGLVRLARAGAGLAVVPRFLADQDVIAGNLKYLLDDWVVDPIEVFAVWPSNAPRNGLISRFVTFLSDAVRDA